MVRNRPDVRRHNNTGAKLELVMPLRKKLTVAESEVIQPTHRLIPPFVAAIVVFASLGLGEAVYRLLYLEFDGATDRLPIELAFGLGFAWLAIKLLRQRYQSRQKRVARIQLIKERNYKIRNALGGLEMVPYAGNQQAIRVIREEVDRIDWALAEIMPQ